MKKVSLLMALVIALSCLSFAYAATQSDIQGTWKCISFVTGGVDIVPMFASIDASIYLVVDGENYTLLMTADGETEKSSGTMVIEDDQYINIDGMKDTYDFTDGVLTLHEGEEVTAFAREDEAMSAVAEAERTAAEPEDGILGTWWVMKVKATDDLPEEDVEAVTNINAKLAYGTMTYEFTSDTLTVSMTLMGESDSQSIPYTDLGGRIDLGESGAWDYSLRDAYLVLLINGVDFYLTK